MARTDWSQPPTSSDSDGEHHANGPSNQLLTARATDSLREEAINEDGTAREWGTVTKYFEEYIMTEHAAANTWTQEKGVRPQSHRFTPKYAKRQTGKIHGGLRHVAENTPPSLSLKTVLVTLTGWPYDSEGQPAPPVDFLYGLSAGRTKAHQQLRRILNGHDAVQTWGRVTITEPHSGRRSGYPHSHIGIAAVGEVTTDDLRPVIETYCEANPFARDCDHGDGALTVRDADAEDTKRLAAELTNNLVGYEFEPINGSPLESVSDPKRRFASLMWATGKQTVSFGETFREWVARSQAGWSPDSDPDTDPANPPIPDDVEPLEYVDPAPVDVAYQYPDGGEGI